jgi:putative ABC transport system substrate-binding protein
MMPPEEGPSMERRGSRLSRRELMVGAAGLGLLAGCGRLPWQAAPPAVPRVGYLTLDPFSVSLYDDFRQGLGELGYVDGQNLILEHRDAERDPQRLRDFAAELARLQVDVIVAATPPAVEAVREATQTTPIVFVAVSDPVRTGFVASLARPGGNLTGTSLLNVPLSGKRLELLRAILPGAVRIGVLWVPDNPADALLWREMQDAARAMGIQLQLLDVQSSEDLDRVFQALARDRPDALTTTNAPLARFGRMVDIVDFAANQRLPTIYPFREAVVIGGFMSYGVSLPAMYRRAAYYVDRILKGTKPADLPVEQPMTFDFVVNMKTAQALGITFPNEIMLQVTEVIQ